MPEPLLHNLIQLLEDWLLRKHKYIPIPTVNTLKEALRSQIVGLGDVACELPTTLKSELPVADLTSPYSIINMSIKRNSHPPQKVSICIDTYSMTTEMVNAEENTPVLLEVQATTQLDHKSFTYNWCENRQELFNSKKYTGIKTPILCIMKPDMDMDGHKFTCKIKASFSELNPETKPITLKVSCELDKYRDSLASMYLVQPEVPEDTWPPQSGKKYINLALIEEDKNFNYSDECVHLTIRNDMDNILQHKQKIEYDDILKHLRSGQVLFVQGRPGCGKTTFVHKITRDWATTSDGPMRLVLLVSLRVLNTLHLQKPDLNLSDILKLFHKLKVSKELLEEREGKGVCFIFDGLDEFSVPDSIVYKIINKQYLYKSTVIVASRPAAIAKLRSRANIVIEVLGFLHDQIIQYFDHYPFSTQSKSAQLKGYLSSHPNILHMCYLPIHAAMVAYLFEVTGKVPQTETEMYKHFTRSTLVRSLSKKVDIEDIDVHNLSGVEENLFSQICRLALENTILNKQVVEHDEVRNYFQTKKDTDFSLGLITIDRIAGLYNYKNIYTFLHLTFQEYLAAHHISTLSDEEQKKLIQKHGHKNHMLVVWKFYCGLIKYDPKGCELFKAVLIKKNSLFRIQCAYESQVIGCCNLVLEHTNASLVFHNEYLTIPDFTALGYVLANTSSPITLSLTECTIISNKGIDALLSETRDKSILLSTLNYKTNLLDEVDIRCLEKLILHSGSLELLNVSSKIQSSFIANIFQYFQIVTSEITANNSLLLSCRHRDSLQEMHVKHEMNDEVSRYFALNSTKWSHLHTLELSECFNRFSDKMPIIHCLKHFSKLKVLLMPYNEITEIEAVAIFSNLKHCTSLTALDLHSNRIDKEGAQAVALCLQHWPNLQELDLNYNRIGGDGAVVIADKLHHCTQLKKLNLAGICIYHYAAEWARVVAPRLQHWPNLQELNLSWNEIGSDGAVVIADNLHHCTQLRRLTLAGNCIDHYAAKSLSILKHCTALTTLDLQCNRIHEEGARAVALCLQHWPNLQELDLNYNRIGSDGAVVIADNLHHCTQLRKLYLAGNCIDHYSLSILKHCTALTTLDLKHNTIHEEGARAVALCLQHWPNLQELDLSWNKIGSDGAKVIADNLYYCTQLRKLNLESNYIDHYAANSLSILKHCTALTTLQLKCNTIHEEGARVVALCLQHWPNLQELDLSYNEIGSDGAVVIADNLHHCTQLRKLNLAGICINHYAANSLFSILKHCTALTTLGNTIHKEWARVVAPRLQHWPNLQELDLSWNEIGSGGAVVIADNLHHCTQLRKLNLAGNCIDHYAAYSLSILKHCTALTTLDLQCNTIQEEGARAVALCLQHWPNLQELDLKYNKIGSDGAVVIANNLHHCTQLRKLYLAGNCINHYAAKSLSILKHCTTLTTLDLQCNTIYKEGARAVALCLQHWPNLQELDLNYNRIGSDGAVVIADNLHHCTQLRKLNLAGNCIDQYAANSLFSILKHCTALTTLHLKRNTIHDEGARVVALCLQHWPNLQKLDLSYNEIGSDGAIVIADNLHHCTQLRKLNLAGNCIDRYTANSLYKKSTELQVSY